MGIPPLSFVVNAFGMQNGTKQANISGSGVEVTTTGYKSEITVAISNVLI